MAPLWSSRERVPAPSSPTASTSRAASVASIHGQGDLEPELADEFRAPGLLRVDERVVVALEHIAVTLDGRDPMQDDTMEHCAAVPDDVADSEPRGRSEGDEVGAVEVWQHARPVDDDERRRPAELRRCERPPGCAEDGQRERNAACES